MRVRVLLLCVVVLGFASGTSAQEPFNVAVRVDRLATLFTDLFGPEGLVVDSLAVLPSGETHSGHFNSAFESEFVQFGTALTSQLVAVPLPSPASGFTYEFDPALGVFNRTTQSFGPILAERAETIGADRLSVGFTYQHFHFDRIEGLDLDSVPAVFTHDDFEQRGGREDVVTTLNSIDANVNQFTAFVTYGINNQRRFIPRHPARQHGSDGGLRRHRSSGSARPIPPCISSVPSTARSATTGSSRHSAAPVASATSRSARRARCTRPISMVSRSDSTCVSRRATRTTCSAPVRPAFNPSRSGRPPTVRFHRTRTSATSGTAPRFWQATPRRVKKPTCPTTWRTSSGADVGLNSRFTFALDFLGRVIIDSPRLVTEDFLALDGESVFPNVTFEDSTFNELDGHRRLQGEPRPAAAGGFQFALPPRQQRPARQDDAPHRYRVLLLNRLRALRSRDGRPARAHQSCTNGRNGSTRPGARGCDGFRAAWAVDA